MDKKAKEEIKQQLTQLRFEAKALNGHLDELESAVMTSGDPDWNAVWSAMHRSNADLRRLVPGVVSTQRRLVRFAINARVTLSSPAELAELTRRLLTKYLNIHGGVYEAIYAQLKRGAERDPNTANTFSLDDPEVDAVCKGMEKELHALTEKTNGPEVLRSIDALEVAASALNLLCDDLPERRMQLGTSLSVTLERNIEDPSVALEILNGE